ncbi:MAG: hypothetical protein KBT21_10920 [Treponema sp.]|nr:hypothetical protein [Candidatus Treponema merdequi]
MKSSLIKKVFILLNIFTVFSVYSQENRYTEKVVEDPIPEYENPLEVTEQNSSLLNTEQELEDFDDLFNDVADTNEAVTTPSVEAAQKAKTEEKKGIQFFGQIEADLGGQLKYNPFDTQPLASCNTYISFTGRPTDYFAIKGTLLAKFPYENALKLDLYELYFDYTFLNFAYITVGKKVVTWGHSKVFDSNILTDQSLNVDTTKILYRKEKEFDDGSYRVVVNVPLAHFSLTGIASYDNYGDNDLLMSKITYAGLIEINFWKMSLGLFGRKWAEYDKKGCDPAFGAELSCDLGDFHCYLMGYGHVNTKVKGFPISRAKGTASLWWATTDKVDMGFVIEYQTGYCWSDMGDGCNPNASDFDREKLGPVKDWFRHKLAAQFAWTNICDTKIGVGLKFYHDFYENWGSVVPGLKINNIFKDAKFEIGFPIYYGTQKENTGIIVDLNLAINF